MPHISLIYHDPDLSLIYLLSFPYSEGLRNGGVLCSVSTPDHGRYEKRYDTQLPCVGIPSPSHIGKQHRQSLGCIKEKARIHAVTITRAKGGTGETGVA
jgi:hypothetical protein